MIWLAVLVGLATLIVSVVNIATEIRPRGEGFTLWLVPFGAGLFIVILALVSWGVARRKRAVDLLYPDSIAWTMEQDQDFVDGVSALKGSRVRNTELPELMTVVVNSTELRIVEGHPRRLLTVLRIPRENILGCRPHIVSNLFAPAKAVVFTVRRESGPVVDLPLAVAGRGPGGLYAGRAEDVEALAAAISDVLAVTRPATDTAT